MTETRHYNEGISDGKWRHMMALEPADNLWRGFRISPAVVPAEALASDTLLPDPSDAAISLDQRAKWPRAGESFLEVDGVISIEAKEFTSSAARNGVAWEIIPGLGRTGSSVAVFPTTAASVDPTRSPDAAPRLDYRIRVSTPRRAKVVMHLLPTHPLQEGNGLRIAVGLDDQPPQMLSVDLPVDSPEWAQGVLDAGVTVSAEMNLPSAGDHVLKVYMVDAGVVLDKIVVDLGEPPQGSVEDHAALRDAAPHARGQNVGGEPPVWRLARPDAQPPHARSRPARSISGSDC